NVHYLMAGWYEELFSFGKGKGTIGKVFP
ncbi:hypothetical protein EZS27_037316, partial [termite gut metagenome]